jgi:hypothetical protein
MDEHEMLLAIAICELLGKDVYPQNHRPGEWPMILRARQSAAAIVT